MLYTGYFENRKKEIINITFNSGGDIETILRKDMRLINEGVNWTVHSKMGNVILQDPNNMFFHISPAEQTTRLCKIRLYKGFQYTITGIAPLITAVGYDYFITGLDSKKCYNYELDCKTNNKSITANRDGYMYVNIQDRIGTLYITRNGFKLATNEHIPSENEEKNTLLIFGEEPVNIKLNSNGIFSPLKLSSATVKLMTQDIVKNLFATSPDQVTVEITNDTLNETLFIGYVTPCIYSQGFTTPYDELEIECVDGISSLEDVEWKATGRNPIMLADIIKYILTEPKMYTWDNSVKYMYDKFEVQEHIKLGEFDDEEVIYTKYWLEKGYLKLDSLQDGDKADDDGNIRYRTMKKILEDFCNSFGLSCVEYKGEVFLVDYNTLLEDTPFTRYDFDEWREEPVPQDIERCQYIYLAATDNQHDLYFTSDSQSVSYDEIFGSIKSTSKFRKEQDNLLDLDAENLICIHPNCPYVRYTSRDADQNWVHNDYYTETDNTYVDIYRFYVHKDFHHIYYKSNLNPTTSSYGIGISNEFDINRLSSIDSRFVSDDVTEVKAALNEFLRNNVCCFVIKHFQYKVDAEYNIPSSYNWETKLFFSYGLRNVKYSSATQPPYSADYDNTLSTLLKNHYNSLTRSLPLLESKKTYLTTTNLVSSTQSLYKQYIQCDGEIYFMKYPYVTECDTFASDKLTEFSRSETVNNITAFPMLVNIGLQDTQYGNDFTYTANSYNYKEYRDMSRDRDSSSKRDAAARNFLYKWHSIQDNKTYTEGVIDLKGKLTELVEPHNGIIKFTLPIPIYNINIIAPHFCMVKGFSAKHTRNYSYEIAVEGEEPEDDTTKTIKTENGIKDELETELNFTLQRKDTAFNDNALFSTFNDNFYYVYNVKYHNRNISLEDMTAWRNYNHYSKPKIILEADISNNVDLHPLNQITWNYKHIGMYIDALELNVIDDTASVTLVEESFSDTFPTNIIGLSNIRPIISGELEQLDDELIIKIPND